MYKIPKNNFCNLSKKKIIYESIESSINLLLNNKQYVALLMFSVCCIDAFSNKKFISYVKNNFSQYFDNGLLTPKDFYLYFRNQVVHGYSIADGYAIANDWEINGEHVAEVKCGTKTFIALNIDKFIADFIKHIKHKFT